MFHLAVAVGLVIEGQAPLVNVQSGKITSKARQPTCNSKTGCRQLYNSSSSSDQAAERAGHSKIHSLATMSAIFSGCRSALGMEPRWRTEHAVYLVRASRPHVLFLVCTQEPVLVTKLCEPVMARTSRAFQMVWFRSESRTSKGVRA